MSGFYSRHAGDKLKQRLKEIAAAGDDRYALDEEIDLSRLTALRALTLWEAAQESQNEETLAMANAMMRDSVAHVVRIVKDAASVRAMVKDTVSVTDIEYIVGQVQRILEDELGGTPEGKLVLDRITKRMDDIRLPETETPPPVKVIAIS